MADSMTDTMDWLLSEDTIEMSARVYSPDQLKNFTRCQKKFFYQSIQRLNWPSDQRNFELGQSVHKLMEYQARGLNCEALLAGASPDIADAFQQLIQHPASQWPVVANEWGFLIPFQLQSNTHWMQGRIDRVAFDISTQTLWVIDWKTGTAIPKEPPNDWQTVIYLYAVVEAYPDLRASFLDMNPGAVSLQLPQTIVPEQVKFLYLQASQESRQSPIRAVEIPYSQTLHQQHQAKILTVLQQIQTVTDYQLPQTCPDPYCVYRQICGIDNRNALP